LAWDPWTHQLINDKALEITNDGVIKQTIQQYRNYFDSGYSVTDTPVMHYYLYSSKYDSTHGGWTFQQCVELKASGKPKIQAFAYGIAAHLIADSVSHNNFVPNQIRTTFIPNNIIHPISEFIVGSHILASPEGDMAYQRAKVSFSAFFADEELQQITQDCASRQGYLDIVEDTKTFAQLLGDSPGGFYSYVPGFLQYLVFGGIEGVVICLIFIVIFSMVLYKFKLKWYTYPIIPFLVLFLVGLIIGVAGGIPKLTSIENAEYWIQQSVERESYIFSSLQNYDKRFVYEPSGSPDTNSAIARADADIIWIWYIIIAVLIGVVAFIIYRKVRG